MQVFFLHLIIQGMNQLVLRELLLLFLPFKVVGFTDYAIPSEWVRVKNTTETIYDGASYITTVKEFSYDNANYSFETQTKTTNSKGNVLTETNKYPLDYKPSTTSSNEEIETEI